MHSAENAMLIKNSGPIRESWIKIDLSQAEGGIISGRLQLTCRTGIQYIDPDASNYMVAEELCLYAPDDSWTEDGITYNTRPEVYDRVARAELTDNNRVFSFDLTDYFNQCLKENKTVAALKLSFDYPSSSTYEFFTQNESDQTKHPKVYIWSSQNPDAAAILGDKDDLQYGPYISNNLTLPSAGARGSLIEWSSSDPEHLTDTGIVTRPAPGADPVYVTLTATLTKGSETQQKKFELTIIPAASDISDVQVIDTNPS